MSLPRIYQPIILKPKSEVKLSDDASHYISRVMRYAIQDKIILFNGQGGEYLSAIKEITKKSVIVFIQEFVSQEVESPLKICLAQGISRGEKMDFTIQKAVELGVTSVVPLFTERCNVKLDKERSEKRIQHWQAVAVSACEQSGRNIVPEIQSITTLLDFLNTKPEGTKLILSPTAETKLSQTKIASQNITILIGPEGGFSDNEINLAINSEFQPICLGPRILRTETAALAAISALQTLCGDF